MVSIWPYHWLYRWERWATPQILFSVPGQAVLELLDKQLWKSGMVHIICQLTCCTWPTAYLPASRAKCDLQHNWRVQRDTHTFKSITLSLLSGRTAGRPPMPPRFLSLCKLCLLYNTLTCSIRLYPAVLAAQHLTPLVVAGACWSEIPKTTVQQNKCSREQRWVTYQQSGIRDKTDIPTAMLEAWNKSL